MKTTAEASQLKSLKAESARTGRLVATGVLAVAFAIASGQGWGAAASWAQVVTYPAPAGEALSADYKVLAADQQVDVYTARVLDPPPTQRFDRSYVRKRAPAVNPWVQDPDPFFSLKSRFSHWAVRQTLVALGADRSKWAVFGTSTAVIGL